MGTGLPSSVVVAIAAVIALVWPAPVPAQTADRGVVMTRVKIEIPASVRNDHEAIQALLAEATRATGRVGRAAKELAGVLSPHFEREEQTALPPLGVLARLAAGTALSEDEAKAVMTMSDTLRRDLPKMLEEHRQIRASLVGLRRAAAEDRAPEYQALADQLTLHMQTEEEVLYPASMLVKDVIPASSQGR